MITIDNLNNIEIIRRDTYIIDLELENYEFLESDEVFFSVKKSKYDSDYILKLKCEHKEGNIAKFFFTTEDTNIEPGIYFYDVQCNISADRVETVVMAKLTVKGDVTGE